MRNPSMPYQGSIARQFQADFTQTSMQNALQITCGTPMPYQGSITCHFRAGSTQTSMQNAWRNLCGIHAESIYALSKLDFTLISDRFHADVHAECFAKSLRHPCKIHWCLISARFNAYLTQSSRRLRWRMLCGTFPECIRNPCEIHLCLIKAPLHANFRQISRRRPCRMLCKLLAEPLCPIKARLHATFAQVPRRRPCGMLCKFRAEPLCPIKARFHANFTQISGRRACRMLCESLWNPCEIHLCLIKAPLHANFTQISLGFQCIKPCGIFAEFMHNPSMPYQGSISRYFKTDFTETSMQNALRKVFRIDAESSYALLRFDFTPISRRFNADVYAECSSESLRNLSMPYQARFQVTFTQISRRPPCRMLCRIHAEAIYALSRHDFTSISRRFYKKVHAESIYALCFAESLRNLSLLYQGSISRQYHAEFTRTSMQNALRNICGIYAVSIYAL